MPIYTNSHTKSKLFAEIGIASNGPDNWDLFTAWLDIHYPPPPKPDDRPHTFQDLAAFKIRRMIDLPNWVCWRWESVHGKYTKVPYIAGTVGPISLKADSGLKSTWRSHDVALASMRNGYDGIGFCLKQTGIGAFDIDNCIDAKGVIHPWALALVKRVKSYTEKTPSGKGLRIIGLTWGTKELHTTQKVAGTPISIECYRNAVRFITVTGLHLAGTPKDLNQIGDLLDEVHAELGGTDSPNTTSPHPDDESNHPHVDEPPATDDALELMLNTLPHELREEIQDGIKAGTTDRSEDFYHAVKYLKDLHWTLAEIEALFTKYPSEKYGKRTAAEARRAFKKADKKPSNDDDDIAGTTSKNKPPLISATPFVLRPASQIPQRDWIYGRHLIRKFGSATVALGGVGKSSLMIVEALAMVTGKALLGITPTQCCKVWYWNGEDPLEEIERRIAAACSYFKITPQEIAGNLFVNSGRDSEIVIATQTRDGAKIYAPMVQALTKTIVDNKIDVVQIDPFISSHRVTENDNNAIELVAKTWTRLADTTNTAIDLAHHSRKVGGAEVTVEDGRGASALINAVRSSRVLNTMSKDEAANAGLQSYRTYFRTDDGKMNLSPPSDAAKWFELKSIELGNGPPNDPFEGGDEVGVVTEWTWPDPLDGVTGNDFEKVAAAIRAGTWKENIQAADWVGYAVANAMGLYVDDKAEKAKIKGLLRVWLKAGKLIRVQHTDAQRKAKWFVEVAEE